MTLPEIVYNRRSRKAQHLQSVRGLPPRGRLAHSGTGSSHGPGQGGLRRALREAPELAQGGGAAFEGAARRADQVAT